MDTPQSQHESDLYKVRYSQVLYDYENGMKQCDIAKRLRVSNSRVFQIIKGII